MEKIRNILSEETIKEVARLYDEEGSLTASVVNGKDEIKINGKIVYQSSEKPKGAQSSL